MQEFYPAIRLAHIATVVVSGALFALRGTFIANGASWPMIPPLRYLSYSIDTFVVATALALVAVVPTGIFASGWLAVKLTLLALYVVLGSVAFKRGRTPGVRRVAFIAAVLVFLIIFAIARSHHPLGWWFVIRDWVG